jgi:hypothetical protein
MYLQRVNGVSFTKIIELLTDILTSFLFTKKNHLKYLQKLKICFFIINDLLPDLQVSPIG